MLKRFAVLVATYCVFATIGVLVGTTLVDDPVAIGDLVGTLVLAPLLDLVPIIAASCDQFFPATLVYWLLLPIGAARYLVCRDRWTLGLTAASSLIMNLGAPPFLVHDVRLNDRSSVVRRPRQIGGLRG